MNSRQRVLKAVNFEKPDRVPIDLGAMRASGINASLYTKLKKRMGIETPTKILDTMQILAVLEPEVLDLLHCDVLPLEGISARWLGQPAAEGVRRKIFDGTEVFFAPGTDIREDPDGSWILHDRAGGRMARMPHNGVYFDFLRDTMSGRRIDPNLFRPSQDVPDEELEALSRRAKFLYENTDKALLGWGAALSLMGLSALLADNITQGSLDQWLIMLMTEKQTAHEMMGRYAESVIARLHLYHQAVGDACFAWGIGSDDSGTQQAELIPPELYVEMIKPYYKQVCTWIHANTNWKTFLHSCGSVTRYIPEWIDAGIDILNPVQISAANMQPEKLMAEFGGKIVFWGGGCDTQQVLPRATTEEVREHVRHNLEVFGQGTRGGQEDGGYVFTQVHNIQQNVPVENVEAMFEAAYEFGRIGD